MFKLPSPTSGLFRGSFVIYYNETTGDYWRIYVDGVMWMAKPYYNFGWYTFPLEELKEKYPQHYRCYLNYRFILESKNVESNNKKNY